MRGDLTVRRRDVRLPRLVSGTSPPCGPRKRQFPRNGDEYLARAADCVACHSIPGGEGFAGGLKWNALGAIYSTTHAGSGDRHR